VSHRCAWSGPDSNRDVEGAGELASEPQVPALEKLPACPRRLKGKALKLWKQVGEQLVLQGIVTAMDLDVLEDLCRVQAFLHEAEEEMAGAEKVLTRAGGTRYQNPLLLIIKQTRVQLNELRAQFGIGPVARTRVRTAAPPVSEEKPAANDKSRFFRDRFFGDRPE
jgi:P27 family predicted phage terminase small subunit